MRGVLHIELEDAYCELDRGDAISWCTRSSEGNRLAAVCGSCSFANEPDDEFCGGCDARLGTPSPATARFSTPDSYTPTYLADKILTSKNQERAAQS